MAESRWSRLIARSFRAAAPAGPGYNLLKTLIQTALFWATFLAAGPYVIVLAERALGIPGFAFRGQPVVALSLFAATAALNLWSGYTMATLGLGTPLPLDMARHLVVRGPYRFVRNPMAVGGLGAGLAVALFVGSWLTVAYVIAGGVIWHVAVRPAEERDLAERFGAPYVSYRNHVRCWWPTFSFRAKADGSDVD